jgi:cytochrome c-type biogenesis protein CcmH/NrfG
LQMQADPTQREALISRAIADWKNADAVSLVALATWLDGKGEYQRQLDTIPLERALQSRDLFLLHLDALGALDRWSDIKQLLESEHFPLDQVLQRMYVARCNARLGEKTASENNWKRALEAAGGDSSKLMTLAEYAERNAANEIAEVAYATATNESPKLRAAWQGRLRLAQVSGGTKKIHAVLSGMLAIWPNDSAIQNDEAYTRLLLLFSNSRNDEAPAFAGLRRGRPMTNDETLKQIEQLAQKLVEQNPTSLPHRTLLALARLWQNRAAGALDVYANIQVAPNALTPAALAVHVAVLAANGRADDAKTEAAQVKVDNLLPEEKALIQNLL